MDDDRGNVRRVQQALNQDAAFLRPDPYLARRVMLAAQAEGSGRRRRKLSAGLVLALVIVLLAAVAAAWRFTGTISRLSGMKPPMARISSGRWQRSWTSLSSSSARAFHWMQSSLPCCRMPSSVRTSRNAWRMPSSPPTSDKGMTEASPPSTSWKPTRGLSTPGPWRTRHG